MPAAKSHRNAAHRKRRMAEAVQALTALKFGPKQRNQTSAYCQCHPAIPLATTDL